MDQLQQKLGNQKRRALGACAVLLWGPPGCGKSQIAREYLWRHRSEYPAGCFWIDCKTKESRAKSFWEIAQAVAILGFDRPRDPAWDESSRFVDLVRKWFEAREGWLIVFDGVTIDNDDDIDAFVSFIPDRSGNNIIYTSVDRTLAKRQRLLNPAAVKIFPLSQQDSCTLLYKSLGIKEPNALQTKKALQLVKHYECLPLAIHAAGHALIAKGTSLDKFNPGTSDHRLAEPFLDIMSALREHKHPEAVNLVTLLSFFAHIVPVALLRFGHQALVELGIEIRSMDSMGSMKKEIDNTIATLIRYGLVERTLLEYSVPSSDRSSSLEELKRGRTATMSTVASSMRAPQLATDDSSGLEIPSSRPDSRMEDSSSQSTTYSIDILRIHTVVQTVLRDELKLRFTDQPDQYWWWLGAASKLLCQSYIVADGKIRNSEGRGLVRDYRDYETQAARMWSHFPKSSQDATHSLRRSRHQLHEAKRTIRTEIQNRSPSQSVDSLSHRVQASVFERANSTSSDSPESDSEMTRTSTWTLERPENQTESPVSMQHHLDVDDTGSEGSWTDRWSQSGMGNSRVLIPTGNTIRRHSNSEATPTEASFIASRPSSLLSIIFQGRPAQARQHKDLGEWKPLPVPPTLSQDTAEVRSRTSSFTSASDDRTTRPTSTGSDASAALAAVHRVSPPAPREGKIKCPSRPQSLDRSSSDESRQPLAIKSANQKMSPLASEFYPSQSLPTYESPDLAKRHHSRHPSSSPRLMQTALSNQAASRMVQVLPIEESISITRRVGVPITGADAYSRTVPAQELTARLTTTQRTPPSGYTSQPMSRDASHESNLSLATAPPAVPGSASLSTSPQIREPYLYSRPGLASIDVVSANSWGGGLGLEGVGEVTSIDASPVLPFESGYMIESYEGAGKNVQFGQMSPVDVPVARARATLAREKSEASEGKGKRRGNAYQMSGAVQHTG